MTRRARAVGSLVGGVAAALVALTGAGCASSGGPGEPAPAPAPRDDDAGRRDPAPGQVGALVAFLPVAVAGAGPSFPDAEITESAARDGYLARLPARAAGQVRDRLDGWRPGSDGDRLFAFRIRGRGSETGAELIRLTAGTGAERLEPRLTGPSRRIHDGRATEFLAVFAVPARVIDAPTPSGDGELAAFVVVGTALPLPFEQTEVTDPAELQRVLAGLPAKAATGARDQLAGRDPARDGDRLFAFALTGCGETTAVLTIGGSRRAPYRLSARLAGGHREICAAPVSFLAVFAVAADRLPR